MTTYKGYEIKQYGDAFFIMLNGERINTVRGTLSCAKHCIDSDYEDMTKLILIDYNANYKGYELKQVEAQKTEIYKEGELVLKIGGNLMIGELAVDEIIAKKESKAPKIPTFEEVVELNTRFDLGDELNAETPLTEQQKEYWLNAYHEGYEQAKSELSHITNP